MRTGVPSYGVWPAGAADGSWGDKRRESASALLSDLPGRNLNGGDARAISDAQSIRWLAPVVRAADAHFVGGFSPPWPLARQKVDGGHGIDA